MQGDTKKISWLKRGREQKEEESGSEATKEEGNSMLTMTALQEKIDMIRRAWLQQGQAVRSIEVWYPNSWALQVGHDLAEAHMDGKEKWQERSQTKEGHSDGALRKVIALTLLDWQEKKEVAMVYLTKEFQEQMEEVCQMNFDNLEKESLQMGSTKLTYQKSLVILQICPHVVAMPAWREVLNALHTEVQKAPGEEAKRYIDQRMQQHQKEQGQAMKQDKKAQKEEVEESSTNAAAFVAETPAEQRERIMSLSRAELSRWRQEDQEQRGER